MEPRDIRLFVSDVDGTLLNPQRELTSATIAAVRELQSAGIQLAIVSQRPLRGLYGLIGTLKISSACAALNGGVIVNHDLVFVSEQIIRSTLAQEVVGALEQFHLDPWVYTRDDWYVRRGDAAHVQHEAEAVGISPVLFETLDGIAGPTIKVTGVNDNYDQVIACETYMRHRFGNQLSISRPLANHLDISHRDANKGCAVAFIAGMLGIPLEKVATAGDGENDIPMFRIGGLSIAMGQASAVVHRAATYTTTSDANDGLAWAIESLILKHRAA
jgi:Cof subfamily protein (haloacid dehalogenase superfamily)